MPEFRTQYDRHRVHARLGDRLKKLYRPQLDDNGHLELVEDGTDDLYAYIQSHRDSVDLHKILERYTAGDVNALNRAQANFGDFTELPTNYAEMLNAVISGEQYFSALPVEVRARFGHSFSNWMSSMDKPDFAEKMGFDSADAKYEQPIDIAPVENFMSGHVPPVPSEQ